MYICMHAGHKRASGILLYQSSPIPLRQELSLNLGLLFSWLDLTSASLIDPLVSASLGAGITGMG